jgi:hypothetical protein
VTFASHAYVERPVGDLAAAGRAATTAAGTWGFDPPELLRSGMNAIFAAGRVVLRVSAPTVPAEVSLELAQFWHDRDVTVPRARRDDVVRVDGLSVTAWERVETSEHPVDWQWAGELVRRVHETVAAALPAAVPLPSPAAFPWWNLNALLERAGPGLDQAARDGLAAAIDRHSDWQEFIPATC